MLRQTRRVATDGAGVHHAVHARTHGHVTRIDVAAIGAAALAGPGDVEVVLQVVIGAFVAYGDLLAEVRAPSSSRAKEIERAVVSSLASSSRSSASPPSIAPPRDRPAASRRAPRRHPRRSRRPPRSPRARTIPPRARRPLPSRHPPRRKPRRAKASNARTSTTVICSRSGACARRVPRSPCASRACIRAPPRRARTDPAANRGTARPSASRSRPPGAAFRADARPASPGWSVATRAAGSARLRTGPAPSKRASDVGSRRRLTFGWRRQDREHGCTTTAKRASSPRSSFGRRRRCVSSKAPPRCRPADVTSAE